MAELTSVAVYRRPIRASLERVWENVRDWEHLPWLHARSFSAIALEEQGDFGWRARIGLHPPDAGRTIRLELVIEDDERRYVSRTLEGPGAGGEIWTHLTPVDAGRTDIEVEFLVPEVAPGARRAVGDAFVRLYTRLWDEDEGMMRRRSFLLDGKGEGKGDGRREEPEPVDLGPEVELAARLPLRVMVAGRPVAVARHEGRWLAFDALCPHMLGPLEEGSIEDGRVLCPWHGFAFDLETGRGCDAARRLRLAPPPRIEVAAGRVWLVPTSTG